MPLSFPIDVDAFREPLAGDHPCGENLQATEAGRQARSQLRDLREEARRIERRADEGDTSDGGWPAARGVWEKLRDGAIDILLTRSRDLEVAAMAIEALARTDGFAGLACGFAVTRALVESSWNDLYPIPDPDDGPADEATVAEERTLPLQRLVGLESEGLLVPGILHIPLAEGRSGESYALCHWRSSRELVREESEEKLRLAVERGATSPADFEQAVASTPLSHLVQVHQELASAAEAWEELSNAVSLASDGAGVLPAGPIRDLFEECDAAFRTFAPAATAYTEDVVETTAEDRAESADAAADGEGRTLTGGREEAFRQLSSIADFFERNDPHSLIAAQIRNVVRLGRLPREDYYRELLRDEAALSLLFRAAGLDRDQGSYQGSEQGDGDG